MNPLRSYLDDLGIAERAFAEQIGISPSYLSRLLSGEREADVSFLAAVQRETKGRVSADTWVEWWRALGKQVA
jgi:transcriptional regulator with XRE-family HTH domain